MTTTECPPNDSPGRGAAVLIRRYVNDEIAETASRPGRDDGEFEFVCECGNLSCYCRVTMTLAEYRSRAPGIVVGH